MPQLSIRSILLLTLGTLTLVMSLVVSVQMYRSWQRLTVLEGLKDAITLSDQIFNLIDKLTIERDVAVSMLQATEERLRTDLRARLIEMRTEADDTERMTLSMMERYRFDGVPALKALTIAHMASVRALRSEIDHALGVTGVQRGNLAARWSNEISAFASGTQIRWNAFIKPFAGVDPYSTQHLRFKYLVRTIIDRAGRERSIVGGLLVENKAPTPAEVAELLRGQGTVDMAWRMSQMLADQSSLYPLIAAEYTDAQSHYATLHDMIQDMFYVPGTGRANYPIGIDLWLEMSTQATDSLLVLRDAATKHTQAHATALIAELHREITFEIGMFGFALLLCGYSFWVVVRRVIKPINGIIEALFAATRGERVDFAPARGRHDEIGKLGQVLAIFNMRVDQIKEGATIIERSQSELRAVVNHAVDGIVTIQPGGAIRGFNPACERIFGFKADEVIGRHFNLLLPNPEQTQPDSDIALAFGEGTIGITGSTGREFSARRKDGTVFPVDIAISAFVLDGQQHFSAIVRDITQRREAEQQLAGYTQALERSNKELDDFAYIASHDLKEPLRGIHNHSRFLLEDNAEKLDPESVGRLDRLVYLSQRMERLVNDLLYFSRLGRQELAIQPTDLKEAIHDIESTLDVFLHERNARIIVGANLPVVVCDKTRVSELFRNLITNAVKYNDKADKTIEVGWAAQHPMADGAAAHNVFFVRDNGRGIAPEFHTEVFRIFKRLQGGKDKEEGTGVGLTFVKKIVERHGGRIWIESTPGQGTTFYFTLEGQHHDREHSAEAA